jgi:hypothetical protein
MFKSHVRLPPRCIRDRRLVVADVSGQCIGPIFEGQEVKSLHGVTDVEYVTQGRLVVSHRRFSTTYQSKSAWIV